MPTTGFFVINASVSETLAVPENRSGAITDSIRQSYQYANGPAAPLQNNLVWSDRRTLGAGATDTIRLNLGGLTDAFGNPVNFASVTGITIFNRETVAPRILNFGPAAANTYLWLFTLATARTAIAPTSGYMQWNDVGSASIPGNADIVVINTDGANAVTYDILVIGRA